MKSTLFIITGLVLTAQTYWLLAWAIWGAPTNVWEYLAFFGSLLLIAAGIIYIWKKTIGMYMICASLVLIWIFYLPAIIVSVRSILVGFAYVQSADWARTVIVFGLLIASTTIAARDARRHLSIRS
jgi:hypothetical protein